MQKKAIVFGGNGTIGQKVVAALAAAGHEVVKVGRNSGDLQADITNPAALKQLFNKLGKVDAIICTAGDVAFAPAAALSREQWEVGFQSKFLGQVNLIQLGCDFLNPGGSITLTSGVLSEQFIMAGASATAFNRAIEGFAAAAACELAQKARINVVSPSMLQESEAAYGAFFPGYTPVAGSEVAKAYVKSALGVETGQIYRVF